MPKISVVIPIYNVAAYLNECLDSVCGQTLSDIEIICVNDGSTDNACDILDGYVKKDERIKVINQENLGVIVARENGIKSAKAEYIYMLDGDDIIAPKTLETLYAAMMAGKGDIITSRVMLFGEKSGEMPLRKPTKLNMVHDNCLVNAALMRRKDFIECGGFDKSFNIALEDYDLWLNLVFNHNKKIYRVPKVLFYYRLKLRHESRNFQHRDMHEDLVKNLYKKYPKMKFYRWLSKLVGIPKKLWGCCVSIKNNRLYLFGICVRVLRKYDCVMAVGAACFVPQVLQELKLRDFSGPFDWMFGSDVMTRLQIIEKKFNHYFDYEDFELVGENPDNGKMVYKNNRTGIIYNHDFPHGDFKDVFDGVAKKYDRRIERVLGLLNENKKFLFVYSELGKTGNVNDVIQIMDRINKIFVADIDLLYINHNERIKLGHYVTHGRVSVNVFYAEYYYEKFPEELSQAARICKKFVKRVAK